MDNKDIELIQQMENKYDTFMPVLKNLTQFTITILN